MKKKPRLYLLSGWGETVHDKNYREIVLFAKKSFSVVPLKYTSDIQKTFKENIDEVKAQLPTMCDQDTIVGFSHGALIAYQLAGSIKCKRVIICSISSILEGDLSKYPANEVKKIFTPSQIVALNKTKYSRPRSETILLYGAKETKQVIQRSILLKKKFKCTLIPVPNTGHRLTKKYSNEIIKIMK